MNGLFNMEEVLAAVLTALSIAVTIVLFAARRFFDRVKSAEHTIVKLRERIARLEGYRKKG